MQNVLDFINKLQKNNNREWFVENKKSFEDAKETVSSLFNHVYNELKPVDHLESLKIYRIYRDVRFSTDKTPYKNHFSMYIGRLQPEFRGGYYLHIEPENSFIGIGFFDPNKEDLLRIRKEIELDDELESILNSKDIKTTFGTLEGDEVKTAPKGFDKTHERIALLKKKQFLLIHKFTDKEVLSLDFYKEAANVFKKSRPFVDYMTDVLLTNLNGERE
ncbi:TIGR02453 family protein [Paenimyroides ummariense]|uniref:TIGR02453 family protein n=1 Tax=Paenimyroides ummariense TaxID=913024 RepID=A0A1I4XU19_9FLAO|nr:DUF2461 domain-containing protein [Paenimyroides ummariense]SFN29342.1 TIGR02453 family protein [Paenimyroides ummariense]